MREKGQTPPRDQLGGEALGGPQESILPCASSLVQQVFFPHSIFPTVTM